MGYYGLCKGSHSNGDDHQIRALLCNLLVDFAQHRAISLYDPLYINGWLAGDKVMKVTPNQ